MNTNSNFSELKKSNKIWAIGSIHSNLESFNSLKKYISTNFEPNDKLVFLGNIIGLGDKAKDTLTSVLDLRFCLMAKFKLSHLDIIFLRGAQEEMFSKLLQLQMAPNPSEILEWLFSHGVNKTIESYDFDPKEFKNICSQGTINISKLTTRFNKHISSIPGHKEYFSNLKHAAFTSSKQILFVNRGVDISRPLSAQNDCFWWGYQNFSKLSKPYNTFVRIVRGYRSATKNSLNDFESSVVCTLFNHPINTKKIVAGIFIENGEILDLFESK